MRIIVITSLIFIVLILKCGVLNAKSLSNKAALTAIEIQNNDTIEIDYYKTLTDRFPFENYKVTALYDGKRARIKMYNYRKLSKIIINNIKYQYNTQNQPNFAGHYIIVTWSCGSPCQMNAIIDMKSGKTVDFVVTSGGLDFRCNSYLLIQDPPSDNLFNKRYRGLIGDPSFQILKNDKLIDLN